VVVTVSLPLIEKAPQKTNSDKPFWHFKCKCQLGLELMRSRCGVKLGGTNVPRASTQPIDRCVICADMEESKTPCQFCGELP
jgi:hypothetical protein